MAPSSKKPRIIIVNDNDEVIDYRERGLPRANGESSRATGLWLTNSKGEVLIAKRALSKSNNPDKWGPAVAGTVEEGETYESNIHKEIVEEIGVTGLSLSLGPKTHWPLSNGMTFGQWFLATADIATEDMKLQTEEVSSVMWVSPADLFEWISREPEAFTPSMLRCKDLLYPNGF